MRVWSILSLLSLTVTASESVVSSSVTMLSSDSFDKFIKANPLSLVKFMAPWCGHCQKLAPEYEKAAEALKKEGSDIKLAEVDATKDQDLAQKYNVQGFPTMFLFRDGKPESYSGGRSSQLIVDWLKKMTGPAVEITKGKEDALKSAQANDVSFVAAVKSKTGEQFKLIESVANENRARGKFYAYVDPSVGTGSLTAIRKGEDPIVLDLSSSTSSDDLTSFVDKESFPLFGPITGENYAQYAARANNWVWTAGTTEDFENLATSIRKVAKNYRTEFNFVWLDTAQHKVHAENNLGLSEFPGISVVYDDAKYIYSEDMSKLGEKSLSKFLQNVKAGKVKRFLKSEPVPDKNDEPVKVVVGNSFSDMVFQKDKDVLLKIYAPWCGHCKKLAPIYDEVATKLAGSDVVLAKFDGTANEIPIPGFKYQGFPTLYFVKAGSKTPALYEGDRSTAGIIKYLKSNASKPLTIKEEGDEENKDEL